MMKFGNTAQKTGQGGERAAANWYKKRGFRLIKQNYRTRLGEVDLILQKDGEWLVFAEVKTRSQNSLGQPCEAVDLRKQKKILAAAQQFLQRWPDTGEQVRFDVIEVFLDKKGMHQCECIENAFDLRR